MKIDKGVPLPERGNSVDTIKEMEIGDSVFFTDQKQARDFAQSIHKFGYRNKLGFSQSLRKVKGGWRVWKVANARNDGGKQNA